MGDEKNLARSVIPDSAVIYNPNQTRDETFRVTIGTVNGKKMTSDGKPRNGTSRVSNFFPGNVRHRTTSILRFPK